MNDRTMELVELLKRQIEIENKTLKELEQAENEAQEPPVKMCYLEMRLDTWKHIKFLEGLVEMINKVPCDEWMSKVDRYIDRVKLERTLSSIMQQEESMKTLSHQASRLMDDPIGKMLLEHLTADERRHGDALKSLIKTVKQMPLQTKKGKKGSDISCE